MASSNQFERLLPLLALAGAGVAVIVAIYFPVPRKRSSAMAVFQKRKNVPDFDYFIKEPTGPKKDYIFVRLSFCILEPYFQGPFNSLKELSLYSVPLVNGEVESILTSCPQLRLWNLHYCKLPCNLLVNALELRTLEIIYCEQVNEIGFSAPNLDYFIYFGKGPLSFSPSYVPNLETLCVGLVHDNRPQHGFEGLGDFVLDAPCLNKLWIQATPNQVVRYIQEMPTLWNLHVLSLHVIKGSLDLRDIISLIAVFPNLSTFDFSSLYCSLNYKERDAEMLPTYVHLKLVVLDGFKFDAAQERFASQLIRCAPALEEMSIYTEHCFYPLGIESKKTLPLEKRVFSNELILRTQLLLKQQSLSSAIIQFITPSLVFRL